MSLSYILAVSASLVAAPALDAREIQQNYPVVAARNNWSAAVYMELLVAPNGKVVKCTPLDGFGNEDFASMFCTLVSKVRAVPAKDFDGNPSFGVLRTMVKMFLPQSNQGKLIENLAGVRPEFELEVESFPGSSETSISTNIAMAIDEAGKVQECEAIDVEHRRYGEVACQQVAGITFPAMADAAAKPISYVRSLEVRFSLAGS